MFDSISPLVYGTSGTFPYYESDRVISELSSRAVMADSDGHSSPLPVTL